MPLTLNGTTEIVYDNLNSNVTTLMQPKNWIINGGFDVWQRGTSQTSSGYGSDDRWINQHNGSSKTHSRQIFTLGQTNVPNNPTYFSRTVISSVAGANNYVAKINKIEDVTKLAGKTVSLSFWAKADSSKNMSIEMNQNFGTGGSNTIDSIGIQKFALTTSWQRFTKTVTLPSIVGKTIGSSNYMILIFWLDAGSAFDARTNSLGNQSGTFDIANVSLVEGSVPIEWQTEAYADVLRQCQRYYYRSNANNDPYSAFANGFFTSSSFAYGYVYLPVEMRVVPTSVEYNVLQVFDASGSYAITSASLTNLNKNIINVYFGGFSGAIQFRPCAILGYNNTSAYLAFNAEL